MAEDTGYVFWGSHYQRSGPTQSTTSSFSAGPIYPMMWADYGYNAGHIEGFHADVGGPVARLSHSGLGSNTSGNRSIHYLSTDPRGSRVAYVWDTGGSTTRHAQEGIGLIWNIAFDSAGALQAGKQALQVHSASGRAGDSMAMDSGGRKFYYAYGSSSNEQREWQVVLRADDQPRQHDHAHAVRPDQPSLRPVRRPLILEEAPGPSGTGGRFPFAEGHVFARGPLQFGPSGVRAPMGASIPDR